MVSVDAGCQKIFKSARDRSKREMVMPSKYKENILKFLTIFIFAMEFFMIIKWLETENL